MNNSRGEKRPERTDGTSVRQVDNALFFQEVSAQIADGKQVIIRAKGSSMWPLLRDGKDKLVLGKTVPESLKRGCIVLARLNDSRFVIHRIERLSDGHVVLRGDGNYYARETCTPADILAEATAVVRREKVYPKNGFLWLCARFLWPSSSQLRRLFLALNRHLARHKNSNSINPN